MSTNPAHHAVVSVCIDHKNDSFPLDFHGLSTAVIISDSDGKEIEATQNEIKEISRTCHQNRQTDFLPIRNLPDVPLESV